jgi:hypothetical protein
MGGLFSNDFHWKPAHGGMVCMEGCFAEGDRTGVSDHFFWATGATGTISSPPAQVTAISGPWNGGLTRQEGINTVYWVWFDEPQYGADGDGRTSAVRFGKVR